MILDPVLWTGVFVVFTGLCVGSFLNVCIHRMPQGDSIANPPSHCPACKKAIAWYDNIPVLSFILLGGKCRHCKAGISPRYMLVEITTAVIWFLFWRFYGVSFYSIAGVILFSILLAVTVTDFETGFIPDLLNFTGMGAGLLLSALHPALQGERVWYWGLGQSVLGLLAGGGLLIAIGWFGSVVFKKDSMGGGDVKLLAMIGTFVGAKQVLFIFLLAPLTAIFFALYMKFFKKAETIPFGPFLSLTGAIFFLMGGKIVSFILSTYGV